jgi:hypothetical protein
VVDKQERPVLSGLIALVAVAAVVGALLGFGALFGARVLGLSGAETTSSDPTGGDSLYLPKPEPTRSGTGPLITLAPGESAATDGSRDPNETKKKPEPEISLSAGQTSVASFQQIDLTGAYPKGDGAILQVQRLEGGKWADFPVTMSVSGGTFSTYVQTSHTGTNVWRVIDTDTGTKSNTVKVKVG